MKVKDKRTHIYVHLTLKVRDSRLPLKPRMNGGPKSAECAECRARWKENWMRASAEMEQEGNPLTSRDEKKSDYFSENFVNHTKNASESFVHHETKA